MVIKGYPSEWFWANAYYGHVTCVTHVMRYRINKYGARMNVCVFCGYGY